MKKIIIPALLLITIALIALVMKDKIGMNHSQHSMNPMAHSANGMPKEAGDAGFAAIAEITVSTAPIEGGYTMEVLGKNAVTNAKIKGLGFFGLMATGSHHQMHHLMMASGEGHH